MTGQNLGTLLILHEKGGEFAAGGGAMKKRFVRRDLLSSSKGDETNFFFVLAERDVKTFKEIFTPDQIKTNSQARGETDRNMEANRSDLDRKAINNNGNLGVYLKVIERKSNQPFVERESRRGQCEDVSVALLSPARRHRFQ